LGSRGYPTKKFESEGRKKVKIREAPDNNIRPWLGSRRKNSFGGGSLSKPMREPQRDQGV